MQSQPQIGLVLIRTTQSGQRRCAVDLKESGAETRTQPKLRVLRWVTAVSDGGAQATLLASPRRLTRGKGWGHGRGTRPESVRPLNAKNIMVGK